MEGSRISCRREAGFGGGSEGTLRALVGECTLNVGEGDWFISIEGWLLDGLEYIGEGGDGDDGAIEYRGCDLGDRKGLSEE